MGKIKLVITDLDGTFLDSNLEPNQSNVDALKACREAGIPVCAITARGYSSSLRVLHLGGFRGYCVTSNGASLYDGEGSVLYKKTIPQDRIKRILEVCLREQAGVFVIARGGTVICDELRRPVVANNKPIDISQWPKEHRPNRIQVKTLDEMVDQIQDDAELVCIHARDEHSTFDGAFYRSIIESGELTLTSSHPGGLDIMANGVSKTEGAQRLADLMGLKPEEVMACGDHNNDIGMLRWAGIGVAMGNAQPQTKAVADFISLDHDKGGVAHAIYKFVL